jgi:hypothetical protein
MKKRSDDEVLAELMQFNLAAILKAGTE